MSAVIYFDTNALAKWHINESRSDDVVTADPIMADGAKAVRLNVVRS
jgi:hypothetical protein